jgi:hypothetical protein
MGSAARHSSGRSAALLHARKNKRGATRRKAAARIPESSLVDVSDALATICATVDVAASALAKDESEALSTNAGQVLFEHVYEPLERQRAIIEAHSKCRSIERSARPRRPKARVRP